MYTLITDGHINGLATHKHRSMLLKVGSAVADPGFLKGVSVSA